MNVGDCVRHILFPHYGNGTVQKTGRYGQVLVAWENELSHWHPAHRLRVTKEHDGWVICPKHGVGHHESFPCSFCRMGMPETA